MEQEKQLIFCYGCHSVIEVRQRVTNQDLTSRAAYLDDYIRVFAGFSQNPQWPESGVASITFFKQGRVYGQVIEMGLNEIQKLDKFEKTDSSNPQSTDLSVNWYRRQQVYINIVHNNELLINQKAWVYIMNSNEWVCEPKVAYLDKILENISIWGEQDEFKKIDVYRADNLQLVTTYRK